MKAAFSLRTGICELEASELDRSVGKAGVVVKHMVAAAVVMAVAAFITVSGVPDVCEGIHCLGLPAVQPVQEILIDRVAIMVDATAVKAESGYQEAFVACHNVGKVPKALRPVVAKPDVNVDSTHMGWVAFRSCMAEVADNFLQVLDVTVVEDGRSHFCFFVIPR